MEFTHIPLSQLVGETALKFKKPIEIDVDRSVERACDFDIPAHTEVTIKRGEELQALKSYLHTVDPKQVLVRLTQDLQDLGMDPSLSLAGMNIAQYLIAGLPTGEYEMTPGGIQRVVAPSLSNDTRFLWKARICDNPFYILRLFAEQQLTGADVECLKAARPQEYDAITSSFIAFLARTYKADTALPRRLRIMLAILFQSPTIKLEQLVSYKKSDVEKPLPNKSAPQISQIERGKPTK